MARLLSHLVEAPRSCSYLADREATLEHRIMLETSADELEALLMRGWRRFGPDYFRPVCADCRECVPTRVPTLEFSPSKSQRRARSNCTGLTARVGPPRVDAERLSLYERWHAERERTRGWAEAPVDERGYRLQFAFPHPAAREIAYYERNGAAPPRLVGLGVCDQTRNCWSAVYFFYDPSWAERSLGVANVIFQIELARSLGIPHVYLGYRVEGCPSMAYKARFHPQERLLGWPAANEEPTWVPAAGPAVR